MDLLSHLLPKTCLVKELGGEILEKELCLKHGKCFVAGCSITWLTSNHINCIHLYKIEKYSACIQ